LGQIDPWQRELLELLIRFPALLPTARVAIRVEQLSYEPCQTIYRTMCELADADCEPTFEQLMLTFEDAVVKCLLVELDERGSAKTIPDSTPVLEELIRSFHNRETVKQQPIAIGMLREKRLDEDQEKDLLKRLVQQARTQQGISEPTDG
jgi:hypothetical protein